MKGFVDSVRLAIENRVPSDHLRKDPAVKKGHSTRTSGKDFDGESSAKQRAFNFQCTFMIVVSFIFLVTFLAISFVARRHESTQPPRVASGKSFLIDVPSAEDEESRLAVTLFSHPLIKVPKQSPYMVGRPRSQLCRLPNYINFGFQWLSD